MSESEHRERTFTVSADEEGCRLDRFLDDHCPDLSRNQIQRALAADGVTVDGRQRPKGYRLRPGSTVVFRPLPSPLPEAVPQDIPLTVVYEDADLLVVDKPAGLVVHPAPGHPDGTLVNALLHHCQRLAAGGDPVRPGIVHRLDRDTSGLLAVALNDAAHRSLTAQLKARTVRRNYLALSWGRWPEGSGVLTGAIGRHPRDRQRMAVVERGGRPAETHYEVTEDFDFVQLCRVRLQTGRTHQIRVHFAAASHPVVGDPLYGDDRRALNVRPVERAAANRLVKAASRQLLHAAELALEHPRSGRRLRFVSEMPTDLAQVLSALRAGSAPV
jgi:23S rRNA pseudouridine1911/1915/1917 synthase